MSDTCKSVTVVNFCGTNFFPKKINKLCKGFSVQRFSFRNCLQSNLNSYSSSFSPEWYDQLTTRRGRTFQHEIWLDDIDVDQCEEGPFRCRSSLPRLRALRANSIGAKDLDVLEMYRVACWPPGPIHSHVRSARGREAWCRRCMFRYPPRAISETLPYGILACASTRASTPRISLPRLAI